MAFDGSSGNCWAPEWPVDIKREQRLRVARMGDGYEQRTIDGLNPMITTWSLTWPMRPRSIIQAMDAYLVVRYGAAFDFLDPLSESIVPVFCDTWNVSWQHKGRSKDYGDLSAEFRIAYGAAIFTPGLP